MRGCAEWANRPNDDKFNVGQRADSRNRQQRPAEKVDQASFTSSDTNRKPQDYDEPESTEEGCWDATDPRILTCENF